MRWLIALTTVIAVAACSEKKRPQTYAEGMAIFCKRISTPPPPEVAAAERQADLGKPYVEREITNPEVLAVMKSLGDANPGDRGKILNAAGEKAGIHDCWRP